MEEHIINDVNEMIELKKLKLTLLKDFYNTLEVFKKVLQNEELSGIDEVLEEEAHIISQIDEIDKKCIFLKEQILVKNKVDQMEKIELEELKELTNIQQDIEEQLKQVSFTHGEVRKMLEKEKQKVSSELEKIRRQRKAQKQHEQYIHPYQDTFQPSFFIDKKK